MRRTAAIVFLLLVMGVVPVAEAVDAPSRVSLLPQWIPQGQFAGYMVALEKGFYSEAGLDLKLLRGGPSAPPIETLESGAATFCTAWLSTGIQKRAAGVRLVNLGQVIQRSALMLLAKKSSGINTPASFDGKKVGIWGGDFRIQPLAFFRKYNVSPEIVPVYSTVNLFLKGGVQAVSAMWYNEYHCILNCGVNPEELATFFFSEFSLNFPEDGLYCLERTYESDPDLCARFAHASLKGWLYAFEHKDEALAVVMKHAEAAYTGTNLAHQRWMLNRMQDLILRESDKSALGKLRQEDYSKVGEILKDLKLIRETPPYGEFYRGPR